MTHKKRSNLIAIGLAAVAAVAGLLGFSREAQAASAGTGATQGVAATLDNKWVSVSTSGNISMSVVPIQGDGSLVASKGTVNVKTNSGTGYQLYVAGSLYKNSDAERYAGLYRNGSLDSADNAIITALQSTNTASTLGVNEWGYAAPGLSGYAAQSLYDDAIASEAITSTTEMNQLTWKGLKGDYTQLRTSDNSDATMETEGEDTDVYYGVRINDQRINGNYRNTVIYTAFISSTTAVSLSPAPVDLTAAGTSTTVTIATGHQSSSQPVTPSQIEVSLFDSANASAQIASCSNITVLSGHDGTNSQPLEFTCTLTRLADAVSSSTNNYDIIVRVDAEGSGIYTTYEQQDCWRFITEWTYNLSFNGNGATSGVPDAKSSTKKEGENYTYTLTSGDNPTKTNYNFGGWSDGTTTYTAGNTITLTQASPSKTLTAVWNEIPVTYTLNYSAGDHAISNSSSFPTQTATQNMSAGTSYTFTIPSTTPTTADNYTFLNWSDGTNNYNPGATIALQSTGNTVTLTAVWKANQVSFSDADKAWCSGLTTWKVGDGDNNTYEIWDSRDGTAKSYKVRKLADGNCWMVQNLALNGGTTLTTSDSDVSSNYTLPASSTSGFSNDSTAYVYLKGHTNSPSLTNDAYDTATNPGAYYSFIAATAGKGTGSSGEVSDSICPKGWNLPTKTQFYNLANNSAYGAASSLTDNFKKAFAVLASSSQGYYYNSSFGTNLSGWWSGTIYVGTGGYSFDYNASNTNPQNNYNKRLGYPVRCLIVPGS